MDYFVYKGMEFSLNTYYQCSFNFKNNSYFLVAKSCGHLRPFRLIFTIFTITSAHILYNTKGLTIDYIVIEHVKSSLVAAKRTYVLLLCLYILLKKVDDLVLGSENNQKRERNGLMDSIYDFGLFIIPTSGFVLNVCIYNGIANGVLCLKLCNVQKLIQAL